MRNEMKLALLALLIMAVMVACRGQAVPRGVTNLTGLEISGSETDALIVNQTSTGDIAEFRDNGTVVFRIADDGTLTAQGIVDVGTWVNLSAQTAISVTSGAIITPTGTYQPLESSDMVKCSISTCIADGANAGDLLVLRNSNAADGIIIDGTGGNVECKIDVVLGAGDTVTLIWNGSDWNCLAYYDNN